MTAILKIEQQIESLPAEDFAELAVWVLERAEEDGMLRAHIEAVEKSEERVSRDEVFGLLDRR